VRHRGAERIGRSAHLFGIASREASSAAQVRAPVRVRVRAPVRVQERQPRRAAAMDRVRVLALDQARARTPALPEGAGAPRAA
jgi:hypothetical protein